MGSSADPTASSFNTTTPPSLIAGCDRATCPAASFFSGVIEPDRVSGAAECLVHQSLEQTLVSREASGVPRFLGWERKPGAQSDFTSRLEIYLERRSRSPRWSQTTYEGSAHLG